ncbi:glycoside hydrolase family 13 protein [Crepidotus variabilis]|uniref:alpha-amylase n=1 Tax=Crepidotus variabilis TaxID=179855 RepID=A0A9P6JU33_9AGAR|nr:glycoside hydrolase family 13 protein [Crepidotus variabilis]
MRPASFALFLATALPTVLAATAEQWRGRSIYQVIVDRYALSKGSANTPCDTNARTWCGGTWNSLRDNLDYIQNAGFTAVWISPVSQNYEGSATPYGDPYHGYWIADATQLNSRFGTADDLKALSAELHRRNMYLMVDVVVNNVMSPSLTPDYSKYMFKDQSYYHPYCLIDYSNTTSMQNCWFGDEKVPMPDVDTKNPTVVEKYGEWITSLVQEYNIDGLRIDAAKHVNMDFWPDFCGKAGVFCMGEVFSGNTTADETAPWQGPQALDSVLNFPLYNALQTAFAIPGPVNGKNDISVLAATIEDSKKQFHDTGLLGNFLENQDVPRWHNVSVDPQSLYNAMTFTFMSDGIPIVYYGQEQSMSGNSDPNNREALWPSNYAQTDAYKLITTLNKFRNHLVNSTDWVKQPVQVMTASPEGIAIMKGPVISILTNIGSPPRNDTNIAVNTPYPPSTPLMNILTCQQWAVGAKGMIDAQYTLGGVPNILVPSNTLAGSGLCGAEQTVISNNGGKAKPLDGGASHPSPAASLVVAGVLSLVFALTHIG